MQTMLQMRCVPHPCACMLLKWPSFVSLMMSKHLWQHTGASASPMLMPFRSAVALLAAHDLAANWQQHVTH